MQTCNEEEASSMQPSNNGVVEPSGGSSRRPKGTGRKKIEIKRIENKLSRKVAFSKRRKGLFKKAAEICESCEVEIAIIVFSAKGRLFCYGYPSVEHVVNRFLDENREESYAVLPIEEAEEDKEEEEEEEEEEASSVNSGEAEFWFDESIENLDMEKLEEYATNLEYLRDNLNMKLEELTMRSTSEIDFLARFGV